MNKWHLQYTTSISTKSSKLRTSGLIRTQIHKIRSLDVGNHVPTSLQWVYSYAPSNLIQGLIMSAIIVKLLAGVVFTILSIILLVGIAYYIFLLLSIITGLLGWYSLSNWFRLGVDNITTRINKTLSILFHKDSK